MSPAGPFPLYFPGDARRVFSSDDVTRRFARVAQLDPGSRVLVLGGGPSNTAVLLARDLGCSVVVADPEEGPLAPVRERVKALGVADRLETRLVTLERLNFPDGEFDAILIQGRVFYSLTYTLKSLRPMLARRGRLGLTYPARVGRFISRSVVEFWERRLGTALLLPREMLLEMQAHGYEPESVETLQDPELDALYQDLQAHLASAPPEQAELLRQEMALHREQNGKSCVSYAFLVGRRKEPGEKPPASRDRG